MDAQLGLDSMQGTEDDMAEMQAQLAHGRSESTGTRSPRAASPDALGEMVYPKADALHEEVVADGDLFFQTLSKLLSHLQIPYKVPKIGGQEIDVHRLYCEVTRLGGLEHVMSRKLFVTVCEPFNFPQSFTNKSFVMRKLYCSILHHYEQVYYHRNEGTLVPIPVNEHQQAQRSAGSPALKRTPSRTKTTPSKHSSGTPRGCGALKSAMNTLINSSSPMGSPSGKRKQSDPSGPSSLSKPSRGGAKSSVDGYNPGHYAMHSYPDLGMQMGYQPLNVMPVSGYDGCMMGSRASLGAMGGDAGALGINAVMPTLISPSTSCSSGTPQFSPPIVAPNGLEAGTHIPCRITAVFEKFYIITMEIPGTNGPMFGQLYTQLDPGTSLAPGVLPHQLVYESRSARKGLALRRTSQLHGGPQPPSLMQPGHMMPRSMHHLADMSTAGGPMMPPSDSMVSGRGKQFVPGLSPHDNLQAHGPELDEFGALDTHIPDDLLAMDDHREWDNTFVGGADGAGVGGIFDEGLEIGMVDVLDADATAAVTAQFSPTTHQDTPKKIRLRSNGDYAVMPGGGGGGWQGLLPQAMSVRTSLFQADRQQTRTGDASGVHGGNGLNVAGVEGQIPPAPTDAFGLFLERVQNHPEVLVGQGQGRSLSDVARDTWDAMPAEEKLVYEIKATRYQQRYSKMMQQVIDHAGDAIGAAHGSASALSDGTQIGVGAISTDRAGGQAHQHTGSGAGATPGHESDTKATRQAEAAHGTAGGSSDCRHSTAQVMMPPGGAANAQSGGGTNGAESVTPFASYVGGNTRAFDARGAVGVGPTALVDVGGMARGQADAGTIFASAEANSGLMMCGNEHMPRLSMSHSMPPGGAGMLGVMPLRLQSTRTVDHSMMSGMGTGGMGMQGMGGGYGRGNSGIPSMAAGGHHHGYLSMDMGSGVGMAAYDMSNTMHFHPGMMDDGSMANHKAQQYKQFKQQQREQSYGPAVVQGAGHAGAWAQGLAHRHPVPSCMPHMEAPGLHGEDLHGDDETTMLHMPQHHSPMGDFLAHVGLDVSEGDQSGHMDGMGQGFHLLSPIDPGRQDEGDGGANAADAFLLDLHDDHMGMVPKGGVTSAADRAAGKAGAVVGGDLPAAGTRGSMTGSVAVPPPSVEVFVSSRGDEKGLMGKTLMMSVPPPSLPTKGVAEQFSAAMNVLVMGEHAVDCAGSPPRAV